MILISKTSVVGVEAAIRGMRNPLNSWGLSDSKGETLGDRDLKLAVKLVNAGSSHRKFLRMIHVQFDVTAPFYWWKEMDTYKVATVANSCSTMHKIHSKPLEIADFSHEHLNEVSLKVLEHKISHLNVCLGHFLEEKESTQKKVWWWQLIQLLPSSYNQLRTLDMNYETLRGIYHTRKNHKLDEWKAFCAWVESLPMAKEFLIN